MIPVNGYKLFARYFDQSKESKSGRNDGTNDLVAQKWKWICKNPDAIKVIEEELLKEDNRICWRSLCENSAAVDILLFEIEYNGWNPYWGHLSANQHPRIVKLLARQVQHEAINGVNSANCIDWSRISANPAAMQIIKNNMDLVDWTMLCQNPAAVDILRKEWYEPTGKIDRWDFVMANPAAMDIIIQIFLTDPIKINWDYLSANPSAVPLIKLQMQKDKERKAKGLWERVQDRWLCENPAMIYYVAKLAKQSPDNVYWYHVCNYNYLTMFNSPTLLAVSDAFLEDIIDSYNSFMDADSDGVELKKYHQLVKFEKHTLVQLRRIYGLESFAKPEDITLAIKETPGPARQILGESPLQMFITLKATRERACHAPEFWDGTKSGIIDLDNYRMLKYFEYLKMKVLGEYKHLKQDISLRQILAIARKDPNRFSAMVDTEPETFWGLIFVPGKKKVANEPVKERLKETVYRKCEPVKEFAVLVSRRNQIAHQRPL